MEFMSLNQKKQEMIQYGQFDLADCFTWWVEHRQLNLTELDIEERFFWAKGLLAQTVEWMSNISKEASQLAYMLNKRWLSSQEFRCESGNGIPDYRIYYVNSYNYCRQTYKRLLGFKSYLEEVMNNNKELIQLTREQEDDVDCPTKGESILNFLKVYIDTFSAEELNKQLEELEELRTRDLIGSTAFVMAMVSVLARARVKCPQKARQTFSDGYYRIIDYDPGYEKDYQHFLSLWRNIQHNKDSIQFYDDRDNSYLTEEELVNAIDERSRIANAAQEQTRIQVKRDLLELEFCNDYITLDDEISWYLMTNGTISPRKENRLSYKLGKVA